MMTGLMDLHLKNLRSTPSAFWTQQETPLMAVNGVPYVDSNNAEKLHSSAAKLLKAGQSEDIMMERSRVLVIYTGGTIGMVNDSGVYKPIANCMIRKLKTMPIFHCEDSEKFLRDDEKDDFLVLQQSVKDKKAIVYNVIEFEPLLDSSNMVISDWIKLANCIKDNYYSYDGFVVLHGTDTMAYTSSALSFMCENLGKPIILTGSQIPIFETRSDGRDNFLTSLIVAGNYIIPEVMICFQEKVFRGNRSVKWDSGSFSAFTSPNMPPLVTLEINIKVDWHAIFRPSALEKFRIETNMCPNVGLLRLFPGITTQIVRAFLQPPVQGVVIQTYGAGNAPSRGDLLSLFRDASRWGVLMINISQCAKGDVNTAYETGLALCEAGVILGGDMTAEAALCKLYYVLGKEEWSMEKKKKMLGRSLRGEMTVMPDQDISISDSELIDSFAKFMSLSTKEEILKVKHAIYPSMMCSAAKANDIPSLDHLRLTGGRLEGENQDGRTPLHVACRMGHVNVVHFLLNYGVSVHAKDCRGETPLVDAVEAGHLEIIKLLRQTGACLSLNVDHIAIKMCCAAAKNDTNAISAWLVAGADPNCSDYDLRTPLHIAVNLNHKEVVVLLLEHEANPDVEDTFGFTARSIAQNLKLQEITKLFLPIVTVTVESPDN